MAVNDRNMAFRRRRANDLRVISQILDNSLGDCNTSPLERVISQLNDNTIIPTLKDDTRDQSIWGYDIKDFKMPLETLQHIKPKDINKGEITLNMKLRAKIDHWNTFQDPFEELNYNVLIKGIGEKTYHFGLHIDKHVGDIISNEPHPIYHIQYNVNPTESKEPNLGDLFYIDTPRIMHKPIDFILGISFLTSNFYPTAFEVLKEERSFIKLHQDYQNAIWKPYFHTLANQWTPFEINNIIWNPITSINPILLEA